MSDAAPYIHPTAVVDDGAKIGPGSKIWHFCHVMPGAEIGADVVLGQNAFVAGSVKIGDHCRIQNNVSLYDGVVLESGVFVGPSAVFTNVRRPRAMFPRKDRFETTIVGLGASLGANCTVVCGVKIGRGAFVGAGAVVVKDVPAFAVLVGNPPRRVGWACLCGERLVENQDGAWCPACKRRYRASASGMEEEESKR